jgi:formate/nitrite transporter FocA (FNT family)
MEWEVMFLCNTIGVLLLFFITFFHLIDVPKEKNGEIIDTDQSKSNEAATAALKK